MAVPSPWGCSSAQEARGFQLSTTAAGSRRSLPARPATRGSSSGPGVVVGLVEGLGRGSGPEASLQRGHGLHRPPGTAAKATTSPKASTTPSRATHIRRVISATPAWAEQDGPRDDHLGQRSDNRPHRQDRGTGFPSALEIAGEAMRQNVLEHLDQRRDRRHDRGYGRSKRVASQASASAASSGRTATSVTRRAPPRAAGPRGGPRRRPWRCHPAPPSRRPRATCRRSPPGAWRASTRPIRASPSRPDG
jgi:hypothetical protein